VKRKKPFLDFESKRLDSAPSPIFAAHINAEDRGYIRLILNHNTTTEEKLLLLAKLVKKDISVLTESNTNSQFIDVYYEQGVKCVSRLVELSAYFLENVVVEDIFFYDYFNIVTKNKILSASVIAAILDEIKKATINNQDEQLLLKIHEL